MKKMLIVPMIFILMIGLFISAQAQAISSGWVTDMKDIPDEYMEVSAEPGRIVKINYSTTSYVDGVTPLSKYAYVYLPYGYDEESEERYDVLYLLHGGGGNAERYFYGEGESSPFKRMLDHMIANGEMEKLLVVTPTFYPADNNDSSVYTAAKATEQFHNEVVHDLIPAVEGRFRSYAETVDLSGLQASRTHRGFGGFSMGSVATWYMLTQEMDVFSRFVPMSGDCWLIEQRGGKDAAERTAEALARSIQSSGLTDYMIFAATGTADMAYEPMTYQLQAMQSYPDVFRFGDNVFYGLEEGGQHDYSYIHQYLYNILPSLWK